MRWTSIFISAISVAVLLGAGLTLRDRFADRPVNVILLTVESLRAERFTAGLAPNFFKAAQQASEFSQHRSIASWTAPNIIALLTGLSPFEQGVHARGQSVPEALTLPLELLADRKMSIGSVQAFARSENFENLGLRIANGETIEGWIARRAVRNEPFLFWHHYLGTHLPYDPDDTFLDPKVDMLAEDAAARERIKAVRRLPAIRAGSIAFEPGDKGYIDALYDGGIREFDAWFQNLWQFLQESGLIRDTLLIVTADHGEELLERGNVGHASTTRAGTLFEESVRVPLFVWWPKRLEIETDVKMSRATDHLNIMPTIFDVLGLPAMPHFSGLTLRGETENRDWYAFTSRGGFAEAEPDNIRHFVAAIARGPWKLIVDTDVREVVQTRLYDLENDPAEENDRSQSKREIVQELMAGLRPRLTAFVMPGRKPATRQEKSGSAEGHPAPRWLFPAQSKTVSWGSIKGHAQLEWSGNAASTYVLEYKAGSGALAVDGQIVVSGTKKDFGQFSRQYWDTWIVPYEKVTLRVREETSESWSQPLILSLSE